jgi:hypothetical protein
MLTTSADQKPDELVGELRLEVAEIDREETSQSSPAQVESTSRLNGAKESISAQGLNRGDAEVVLLLREMRNDLVRLTKISAKASRRSKAHLKYLKTTRFSRRFGIAMLILIAILMVIQILQMAGYGPGGGNGGDNNTQTLQRVNTRSLNLERIHTAG